MARGALGKTQDLPQVGDSDNYILFDCSKDPLRSAHQGFKNFTRKCKTNFKIIQNKDDLSAEILDPLRVRMVVLAAPRKKYEGEEIRALKEYVSEGGSLLILASEGKEGQSFGHLNKLIEDHGIRIQNDAIVRTVYFRDYFHPKECFVKKVSLVDTLDQLAAKTSRVVAQDLNFEAPVDTGDKLSIAYPYGASLTVAPPATPIMTSGPLSFPANRAIGAFAQAKKGRIVVIGSVHLFDDTYLNKADNVFLSAAIIKLLTEPNMKLDSVDADRPEFGPRIEIPDTEALAERVRACLQEGEELPVDFTQLFDHSLFKYDTNIIPECVKLYEKLNVKHEPLSLIPPQFEVPLPALQPAVFMPCMRELPPPALDLFDLDEHFSNEKLRLAQLTNKCTDSDLEYYVRESGEILGVAEKVREEMIKDGEAEDDDIVVTGKQVLEFILKKLVNYKKMEQDSGARFNQGSDPLAQSLLTQSQLLGQSVELGNSFNDGEGFKTAEMNNDNNDFQLEA